MEFVVGASVKFDYLSVGEWHHCLMLRLKSCGMPKEILSNFHVRDCASKRRFQLLLDFRKHECFQLDICKICFNS